MTTQEIEQQRDELLGALKGVAWKLTAYQSHWSASPAELEAIATVISRVERAIESDAAYDELLGSNK